MNNNAILVVGTANSGKSSSLRNLENRDKWVYLNTDMKDLPVRGNFLKNIKVTNAPDVLDYIPQLEQSDKVEGVILDTVTFLMNMYERQYVRTSPNTQQAWGDYGAFYGDFIHMIKAGTKPYIIMAHVDNDVTDAGILQAKIPVKGAVGKIGVEADFTSVVTCKQIPIKKLEGIKSPLLNITPREEALGVKHVFQTIIDKSAVGDRTRSPWDMWELNEMYIDNDIQLVINRHKEYYGS